MITTSSVTLLEKISVPLQTILPATTIDKVRNITLPFIKGFASIYLGIFGAVEIKQCVKRKNPEDNISLENRVLTASKAYLNLHGALIVGSGIFSLLDALHEFGLTTLSHTAEIISIAGNVLFLCANIIALEENVRLFNEIKQTDWAAKNIDANELHLLKQSAFWGILSNVGYIVGTANLLFGGATAITLVFLTLACLAGSVKILYDLVEWKKNYTSLNTLPCVS